MNGVSETGFGCVFPVATERWAGHFEALLRELCVVRRLSEKKKALHNVDLQGKR